MRALSWWWEQLLVGSAMPTALRQGPYRLFFHASDQVEREHVHVEMEGNIASYWLEPVRLQHSGGFRGGELRKIEHLVEEHRLQLVRAWDEFFGA
jgi:hypothetical protein